MSTKAKYTAEVSPRQGFDTSTKAELQGANLKISREAYKEHCTCNDESQRLYTVAFYRGKKRE